MTRADDLETISSWMERVVFVVALAVALYLGALGPWQTGGAATGGACSPGDDASKLSLEGDDPGAVEVYVSKYPAHADGARCEHRSLGSGDRVTVEGVTLSVTESGAVLVGGSPLEPSQNWFRSERGASLTDPWYTHYREIQFTNAGPVAAGTSGGVTPDDGVTVVRGTVVRRARFNPVIAATFLASLMVVIGVLLEWSVRFSNVELYED